MSKTVINFNRLFYFLMLVLSVVCVAQGMKHDLDFQVFYKVAQQYLNNDYEFYKIVVYPGWPYRYGPLFPFLLSPLGLIDKQTAQLIWSIVNALALPLAWYLTEEALVRRVGEIVRSPGARILTLIFVVDYITRNASLGNVNLLMYLSFIWGIVLSDRGKPWLSGLAIALGACVKVYSGAASLYFLCTRKWREFFSSAILTFTFILVAPAVIYGPHKLTHLLTMWLTMLQDRSTYPFFKYINQAPLAVFWRVTENEFLGHALNLALLVAVFVWLIALSLKLKNQNPSTAEAKKIDLMILLTSASMPLFALACVYIEYHLIALPVIFVANVYLTHGFLSKGWRFLYAVRFIFVHLAVLEIAGRALTEKAGFYGNHLFGLLVLILMIYFTRPSSSDKISHA